jgi:hypothetical protein
LSLRYGKPVLLVAGQCLSHVILLEVVSVNRKS